MRSPWIAIVGAVAAAIVAFGAAIAFVSWRSSEQERALHKKIEDCRSGTVAACDVLRDACEKKSAAACRIIGELHLEGAGVEKNAAEGLRYLTMACEARDLEGCKRACGLGSATACQHVRQR